MGARTRIKNPDRVFQYISKHGGVVATSELHNYFIQYYDMYQYTYRSAWITKYVKLDVLERVKMGTKQFIKLK